MILEVRACGARIGALTHDAALQRWAFAYDAAWLERSDRFALSPALPIEPPAGLSAESHSNAVRLFFENLLPEGQALDDAAATYKLSRSNSVGLLAALGRETAGALEISGERGDRHPRDDDARRHLSRAELSERIRARPHQPFTVWDGRVRLSIAGYQDKLAVLEEAGEWYLAEGSTLASTHLLKPEPINERLAGMTTNERLCMALAAATGLSTARTSLEHVPEPVLVVERFDRSRTAEGVARRHCIDGCQALGLPVSLKYERPYGSGKDVQHIREGATLPALFALLGQQTASPARERVALLRWVIFQTLIGNVDGHAKNLSFLVDAGGLRLAPAYDVVCGLVYEGVEDTLALAVGDEFSPRALTAFDWGQLATNCGLPPRLVAAQLKELSEGCLAALAETGARVLAESGSAQMIERVGAVIRSQAERALEAAPLVVSASR